MADATNETDETKGLKRSTNSKETNSAKSKKAKKNSKEVAEKNKDYIELPRARDSLGLPRTKFPDVKLLFNLSESKRSQYTEKVEFRQAVEAIEDEMIELGELSSTKPDPDKVFGKFSETKFGKKWLDGPPERKKSTWNDWRSNGKKEIEKLVDKHNVDNGHPTALPEYRENQIALAQKLLDELLTAGFKLVSRGDAPSDDDTHAIDAKSLATMLKEQDRKFADMDKKDFDEWNKDEKAERKVEQRKAKRASKTKKAEKGVEKEVEGEAEER